MGTQTTRAVVMAAAIALGLGLSGCGSGGGSDAKSSEQPTASPSAISSTSAAASGPAYTVADYLKDNGITQTFVKKGDPGIPVLDLPMPAGWKDLGPDTPADAWGAIVPDDPAPAANPPAIIAHMARLTGGDVDQDKILDLAPNALRNQPGYQGPDSGETTSLAGFDATAIAGTVVIDGQTLFGARKTVVIAGNNGIYLLALDAQGPADQRDLLLQAMTTIDSETTIEP